MIASPDDRSNQHLDVLAELSSKLIEDDFIDKFLNAKNTAQALEILFEKVALTKVSSAPSKGFIIGATGCPAGVAHTNLAAEALEKGHRNGCESTDEDAKGLIDKALAGSQYQAGKPSFSVTESVIIV
ncbi:MAG: hypothetical protein ACJAZP_002359 [Psychromonas sp.]|jgi:hypothetical protein